mmetsp:Transcript_1714/g.7630  ORF Transcript_1714/g.7630 Transcript_1714/m.7630 type:complete len:246 (-) Transcript_1714:1622-2359(-)
MTPPSRYRAPGRWCPSRFGTQPTGRARRPRTRTRYPSPRSRGCCSTPRVVSPRGSWIATFPSNPPRGWSERRRPPLPKTHEARSSCATATSARGSTSSTSPRRSPRPGSSSPRRSLPNPSRPRTPSRHRRGPGRNPRRTRRRRETSCWRRRLNSRFLARTSLRGWGRGTGSFTRTLGETRTPRARRCRWRSWASPRVPRRLPARRGRSRRGSPSRGSGRRRARRAKKFWRCSGTRSSSSPPPGTA